MLLHVEMGLAEVWLVPANHMDSGLHNGLANGLHNGLDKGLFGLTNFLDKVCSVWPRLAKVRSVMPASLGMVGLEPLCPRPKSVWPIPVLGCRLHPGKRRFFNGISHKINYTNLQI